MSTDPGNVTELYEEYDYRCECHKCAGDQWYMLTEKPHPEERDTATIIAMQCVNCGWRHDFRGSAE